MSRTILRYLPPAVMLYFSPAFALADNIAEGFGQIPLPKSRPRFPALSYSKIARGLDRSRQPRKVNRGIQPTYNRTAPYLSIPRERPFHKLFIISDL